MGIQDVDDVTLIRHAYVLPDWQRRGVGGRLLAHLMGLAERQRLAEQVTEGSRLAERPLLVGTWAAAWWAVAFYERHGFALVTPAEKDRLLRRYWRISRAPGGDVGGAAAPRGRWPRQRRAPWTLTTCGTTPATPST